MQQILGAQGTVQAPVDDDEFPIFGVGSAGEVVGAAADEGQHDGGKRLAGSDFW